MAHNMTNRGLMTIENTAISSATDIRAAVFKGTAPSAATIRDMNFLSDLIAVSTEAAAVGYARADLASVAIAENDTPDTVTITAAAPTMTSVAAGETWTHIGYYIETASTPTDANRILLSVDTPTSSIATNGSNITLPALTYTTTGS